MIRNEQIEELLRLPVDERRQLLQLLQESLPAETGRQPPRNGEQTSTAAQWLLSISGRYAAGSGDTASHADEIIRTEINKQSGLTTK